MTATTAMTKALHAFERGGEKVWSKFYGFEDADGRPAFYGHQKVERRCMLGMIMAHSKDFSEFVNAADIVSRHVRGTHNNVAEFNSNVDFNGMLEMLKRCIVASLNGG